MIFSLANMIKTIKAVDGVDFNEIDFFEHFFGTLALNMDVKVNGKPLSFSPPRVSEVMTGKDDLYESVAKLADNPVAKPILLEMTQKAKAELFGNVGLEKINDFLSKETTIGDEIFNKSIDKKLSQDNRNDEDIFTEYLLFAMKLEYENRLSRRKYKTATGNFVTKKADASICSELIEQIIKNAKTNMENIKHDQAWSLEDKMNVNRFNEILKDRIHEAFDDFETVMTAIDNLSMLEIQAKKTLYSSYKAAYYRVLANLFGDHYSEEDIKKSSSNIFVAVDDFIYEQMLKGKVKIQEDVARYNLFCITVAVFYQCKFLIKVEEEKK